MLRIAVLGATGRMGREILRLALADGAFAVSGAAAEPADPEVGRDAGELVGAAALGVAISGETREAVDGCDVAIDFTLPAATGSNLAACRDAGTALVMGTTGLDQALLDAVRDFGSVRPIVYSRNMSVGVTLLTALSEMAARALGEDYDAEIIEAHHRAKLDAPSGTALQLGEAVAAGRGVALNDVASYGYHGRHEARRPGSIGFASVRAGRIVGEHEVLFGADEELVRLTHQATDRAVFARGALRAARWVVTRPAGVYSMADVLGLA